MRKYFVASAVAVLVFAFAAFAASLNVNAGSLQVGQDLDLECAERANVVAWGYNDHVAPGTIDRAHVELVGNECDNGEHLHLALLDGNGNVLVRGMEPITSAEDRYTFVFSSPADGIAAEDIEGVRIGIDQGHQDYTF